MKYKYYAIVLVCSTLYSSDFQPRFRGIQTFLLALLRSAKLDVIHTIENLFFCNLIWLSYVQYPRTVVHNREHICVEKYSFSLLGFDVQYVEQGPNWPGLSYKTFRRLFRRLAQSS